MFSTDKPITDVSEDKLGRSGFAERLAKAIIKKSCTEDGFALGFLVKFVRQYRNSDGSNALFDFEDEPYQDYLSESDSIAVINRMRKRRAFWELKRTDIERAAAFSLLIGKSHREKVSINEVNSLLSEWENEYNV